MIEKTLITDVTGQSGSSNDVACIQSYVVANVKMSEKCSEDTRPPPSGQVRPRNCFRFMHSAEAI